MKWSFATVGLIILGLFGFLIIILFHEITVSNEQDYYTLKDAAEAAMIESVDVAYYRLTGDVKINQEKFVENFTRRFYESATFGRTTNYVIEFYQIIETPAKVSLRIVDATRKYRIFTEEVTETSIVNQLSAILEGYQEAKIEKEWSEDQTYTLIEYTCKASNGSKWQTHDPAPYLDEELKCIRECKNYGGCESTGWTMDRSKGKTVTGYACIKSCPFDETARDGKCYKIEEEVKSTIKLSYDDVATYKENPGYDKCTVENNGKKRYVVVEE